MTGEPTPAQGPAEPPPRSVLEGDTASTRPPRSGSSWWRSTAKWILGSLLVLNLGVLLLALSLAHVTTEGPAKRSLGQSVAILTEIDAFLDDHFETLRQEAEETQEANIKPPDFPIPVSFTAGEILEGDREQFRVLLLTRSAERVYEEGMSVFQEERGTTVSFFSPQGAVRAGMNFLREGPHDVLTALTVALAATAGALVLGLMLACRGYGRLVGLGVSVSLAAVPFLILAIAVRFAFRLAADGLDDYLVREFLKLGQELTWAPIRNGIIFSVGSAVFLVLGAALALWNDRQQGW